MSSPLEQVIDHAADMQQRLDRLYDELLVAYLCILALGLLVALIAYRVHQR